MESFVCLFVLSVFAVVIVVHFLLLSECLLFFPFSFY